jgi:hypothetical protein
MKTSFLKSLLKQGLQKLNFTGIFKSNFNKGDMYINYASLRCVTVKR